MRRATLIALIALSTALAGCIAAPDASLEAARDDATAGLALADGRAVAAGSALAWDGRRLAADERPGEACTPVGCLLANPECSATGCGTPCGDANCDRVEFDLVLPDGYWDAHDGGLRLAFEWDDATEVHFEGHLEDASGARLLRASLGASPAAVAYLHEPEAGRYAAVVLARAGEGAYRASAALDARPATAAPLLPNLVTLTPTDLRVESPVFLLPPPVPVDPFLAPAGVQGCGVDEAAEQGARRCLRFSNSVGNAGTGVLEVRLTAASAAATAATGAEEWTQRLYAADGSFEDHPVGAATFHKTHGHYHYAGLAAATVYRYDLAARERGEPLNEGRKAGFCFGDVGIVDLSAAAVATPRYGLENCQAPTEGAVFMGITPGWLDLYQWSLPEQYVDITGAEDGVYELVSVANADGTLVESDLSDNGASVLFRLTGNAVDVLGPP